MSQPSQRHEMATKKVLYHLPGEDSVVIRRDVEYQTTSDGPLTADFYYPPNVESGARLPAVLFVIGYSDVGAQAMLGCRFREMESFISWGKLAAASGLVGITYSTGKEPAADVHAIVQYVRENAATLEIDENRIGVWACSGHGPVALSLLMQGGQEYLKCAALCYAILLDLDGSASVAELAQTFRFVNPNVGKSVEDLPRELPLFLGRCGRDEVPHLDEVMDRFVAKALAANLPVALVNHPEAPHAFDITHDSETSREIIRQVLAFLRFHLLTQE